MLEPQPTLLDGQCPICGVAEIHAPDCPSPDFLVWGNGYQEGDQSAKARLHFLAEARNGALDLLAERYQPRLRALHDEYRAKVDEVEERFREQARELAA